MAKSKLAGLKPGSILTRSQNGSVNDMTIMHFEISSRGRTYNHNLSDFFYFKCDPAKKRVEGRATPVLEFAKAFDNARKDGASKLTLHLVLSVFKRYVIFCDHNQNDPFSKRGFLAFCGPAGEAWRLVRLANEPKPYLFMYDDGEELGLKEHSCSGMVAAIRRGLTWCKVYSISWESGTRPFRKETDEIVVFPYTEKEMRVILRRLQLYFFSLATQLIDHAETHPGSVPPQALLAELDMQKDGSPITLLVKAKDKIVGRTNEKSIVLGSPFNQCMQAAYYLFSYYTSFNDSSITNVRHPIDIVTAKKEGRIIKYATVRGWKGRSRKHVEGLFSDTDKIDDLPEADEKGAGHISADINSKDGKQFIQTLVQLSLAYNPKPHGKLIYSLAKNGSATHHLTDGDRTLTCKLNLLSENRRGVTDHLIQAYYTARDEHRVCQINTSTTEIGSAVVRYTPREFGSVGAKNVSIHFAYAAISSLTDVNIKNAILPLSFEPKDGEGNVTIRFKYLDGIKGSITVPKKYKSLFEDLQEDAERYNPYRKKIRIRKNGKPILLLPVGTRINPRQWDGLQPVTYPRLREIGLRSNDYFLNLTSQRFRVSTANAEFKSIDGGLTVSQILQHSLETLQKHYSNGHPDENKLITSQSLQVLEEIAKGHDVDSAKENIRKKLEISVLAHDEYLALRKPTNPNGILCTGSPEIVDGKDMHGNAMVFAKKMGLVDQNLDIDCYQYDLCPACKNAKLVDDVDAVYKLLSFIECLNEAVDHFPGNAKKLTDKARHFQEILEKNIPLKTIEMADRRLIREGRYELLNDSMIAVAQYL